MKLALGAMVLAVGHLCAQRRALAVDEIHATAGLVAPVGFPDLGVRPTLGGDLTWWWAAPGASGLGLLAGLDVTQFPFGSADGEPVLGERSGYNPGYFNENVTLLPRVMVGFRAAITPSTALSAFLGPTFMIADELGLRSIIPLPTAAVAFDVAVGAERRFGLRAALGVLPYERGRALFTPSLAFTWR